MANTTTSANMGMPVPVPTVDPGPTYAVDLNTCLALIDAHDHSSGKGVQISSDGIDITSDLSLGSFNITDVKSVRLYTNAAALSGGSDLGCLYRTGVDLYYNDGSGNQIRITQSGSVAGASGTITGLPSGTASAAFSAVSGTFQFLQATSTGANIDAASLIVRYPGSYPTPSGNYVAIQAPSSLASGYALTLPSLPAQTNVMTLSSTGTISSTTWNDVAANRTRTTGTSVAAGGVAISNSSGTFTSGSGSLTDVTNLSVTIVTSGRPVQVMLVSDGSGNESYIGGSGSTNVNEFRYAILRGATEVHRSQVGSRATKAGTLETYCPPGAILQIDPVAAGTYTYKLQTAVINGDLSYVYYCKLIAFET